jgi:hypothetical protein
MIIKVDTNDLRNLEERLELIDILNGKPERHVRRIREYFEKVEGLVLIDDLARYCKVSPAKVKEYLEFLGIHLFRKGEMSKGYVLYYYRRGMDVNEISVKTQLSPTAIKRYIKGYEDWE